MRLFLVTFLVSLSLLLTVAAVGELVANSRYLTLSAKVLKNWAESLPEVPERDYESLRQKVLQRIQLYEAAIERNHLIDGMVVNRSLQGQPLDECDSLLFSAIRYVSLVKLGPKFENQAQEAWNGIQNSYHDGHWQRHPLCPKSTSRDMILGLLIALSQNPESHGTYLRMLIEQVRQNDGYFSYGPVYVSFLTPTVANLTRLMALKEGISERRLPSAIRESYSTTEIGLYTLNKGYEAHLVALSTWLELELLSQKTLDEPQSDSFLRSSSAVLNSLVGIDPMTQVHDWRAYHLVRKDPQNLFFRYLRLKTTGSLSSAVRYQLLKDLSEMSAFPEARLPLNCDRRADYLWQRASNQYTPAYTCRRQYNGVDFLWMAALLLNTPSQLAQHSPKNQ